MAKKGKKRGRGKYKGLKIFRTEEGFLIKQEAFLITF